MTSENPATTPSSPASVDSFGARDTLEVGEQSYEIFRLDKVDGADRLPYSLKVLLENLLRTEDGANITAEHIRALADWDPNADPYIEIQFTPARVIMQDFTGVPCVVDLATMREAVTDLGGDPDKINPLAPAEMVIDHSVITDVFGRADAFERNVEIEYERNRERYQFLRWGQTRVRRVQGRPAGHRHRAPGQHRAPGPHGHGPRTGQAYPDTCVGTDSHTTMVNGLGVLGWGVGGIEAEAAMLGQPVSMLIPRVVGFKLTGEIPAGATATDVVLTITEMLRKHGVVGKFVEFYGDGRRRGPAGQPGHHRQHEPGVRLHRRDVPDRRGDHPLPAAHRPPGRAGRAGRGRTPRRRACGTTRSREPVFSEYLELDLSTVVPSIAGPKRPQDRIELTDAKDAFRKAAARLRRPTATAPRTPTSTRRSRNPSRPATRPRITAHDDDADASRSCRCLGGERRDGPAVASRPRSRPTERGEFELDHGAVVIASITSCTNTSNPSVMLGAALLARNAVDKGLTVKPWVKTSMAPGSQVVTDYYEKAGLWPYLEKLGYHLVGYGCTTCIGNSGPLPEEISAAVNEADLTVVSVLSGNRNFEGRINPDVKMNYLASPPLVIAYALAGTMDFDFETEPLGQDTDGNDVFLKDIWPTPQEIQRDHRLLDQQGDVRPRLRGRLRRRRALEVAADAGRARPSSGTRSPPTSASPRTSTACRPSRRRSTDIAGARVLAKLGDSVTTDHISPAGAIKAGHPGRRST